MKHFWTTAAAAALCALTAQAFTAEAWGAAHHHHAKHAKAKPAASRHLHAKGGRVHAKRSRAARAASAIRSEGGSSVKVGKGETLTAISRKTGVSVEELAKLNHLKKPYHLSLGARVKLPSRRYYSVKSGDTLYALSRRFGVGESDLSDFNSLARGKHLRAGQKLYLPGGAADSQAPPEPVRPERSHPTPVRPVPRQQPEGPQVYNPPPQSSSPSYPPAETPPPSSGAPPASTAPQTTPQNQPFELTPERPRAAPPTAAPPITTVRPLIQTSPTPSASDVVAAGRGKFSWPVEGRLITGFGPTRDGQRNDGLNISGALGDPVRASADGEVVYAGDQVPSFGNLVLIKHAGGWVTAYAHMSSITVKNRDEVTKGQQIGLIGQTGSVTQPQLHFEIRYAPSPKDKAVPIDPMLLLQPAPQP